MTQGSGNYGFRRLALLCVAAGVLGLLFSGCPQPEDGRGLELPQYTITFESHDGSEVQSVTANVGTVVDKPADPTRAGYTFLGWFTAETGGTLYSWPHTLTVNVTMHAQWQDNSSPPSMQYTITFESHDGSEVQSVTANVGTAVDKPADPTRAGYTFLGWFNAETGGALYSWPHTLTANVTMHAQWQDNSPPPVTQYTITFDSHSGSEVQSVTANVGTAVDKPADPTRAGYTFLGWFNAETGGTGYTWPHTLTGTVSMHAQWTAIAYTVVYNANNGSGTISPSSHTYDIPKNLSVNAFIRTGYIFGSWNTEANGSGITYADGASALNLSSTGGATVTLYAQWTAISYTVVYDANGGSGTMTPSVHTYDIPKNLSVNAFTRSGYVFWGWNTEANGSGTAYVDGVSVLNLSSTSGDAVPLYAQWVSAVSINISVWVNEDGNILSSANNITISKSGSGVNATDFSAEVTGSYSGVQWYLNEDPIAGSRGTAQSITINAADYENKSYYLGVSVSKDGVPYSTDIHFRVID